MQNRALSLAMASFLLLTGGCGKQAAAPAPTPPAPPADKTWSLRLTETKEERGDKTGFQKGLTALGAVGRTAGLFHAYSEEANSGYTGHWTGAGTLDWNQIHLELAADGNAVYWASVTGMGLGPGFDDRRTGTWWRLKDGNAVIQWTAVKVQVIGPPG